MVFEFLVVLIVSLIFGNGLLYLTGPKEKTGLVSLKEQIQEEKEEKLQTEEPNVSDLSGNVFVDEAYSVQASLRSVNEKIKLAHERINDLEASLQSINSVLISSKPETPFAVDEKIKNLDNFRRNTKIELEAIKKLLKQLKEFRKIKGKKTPLTKNKEQELNKRIHELVFNTKKEDQNF